MESKAKKCYRDITECPKEDELIKLRADNERLGRLEEACTGYFHRDSVTGDVYPPGWDKTQAEREALATIGRLLEEPHE